MASEIRSLEDDVKTLNTEKKTIHNEYMLVLKNLAALNFKEKIAGKDREGNDTEIITVPVLSDPYCNFKTF